MPDENVSVFEEDVDRKVDVVSYEESRDNNRVSGISFIGNVSWGTHLCQFYKTKEDLLDILVPYFKAGLENNEFCMWVTSKPLSVEEAKTALGKVVKDLDDYIKKGQMEIFDYRSWHVKSGKFDSDRVLKGWVEKEKKALKKGFDGLRLTGNTFWLEKKDWDDFKSYEETVNDVIDKHRIIAICSYSLEKCNASEVIDVVSNHQFAIIKRKSKWNIIESSKRKKIKETLNEKTILYETLVNTSPEAITVTDLEGRITYLSPQTLKLLGYDSEEELLGHNAFEFIAPEDHEKAKIALQQTFNDSGIRNFECTAVRKDGTRIILEESTVIIRDSMGNQKSFMAIAREITDRKKAEEALREGEEKWASLTRNTNDIIMIVDNQGILQYINKTLTPYTPKETIGKTIYEYVPKDHRDIMSKSLTKVFKTGEQDNYEVSSNIPKIGIIWFSTKVVPIKRDGAITDVILISTDITEHKRAEEIIVQSEKKFRELANSLPEIVYETDEHANFTFVNQTSLSLTGYTQEDFKSLNASQMVAPIDRERVKNNILKVLQGEMIPSNEYLIQRKDGTTFPAIFHSIPIIKENKIAGFRGFAVNITERKKAEEKIKIFSDAIDSAFDCVMLTDLKGNITYANESAINAFGYTPEEFLKLNITELDTDLTVAKKVMQDTTVKERWSGEVINIRKNKEKFPAILSAFIIKDDKGNSIGTMGILRDITESKKVEEALKQSEKKYRILFNDVPVGIGITDKSGHIVDCNQHMAEIFGMTVEELKATNIKSLYVNPKDRERLLNLLNKEGRVVDWECPFRRKDGTVFFAILNIDVVDRNGQKLLLTTMRDITERKVAEEKIKKQNVQLKKLDRIKTDFLNVTSHELRTPMASIKGYVQMILKGILGDVTEEERNALEVVLRNINRLDHLIQDILDISLLESKSMKFIPEKTNIKDVISEIIESMNCRALEKNIKIITEIDENLPDVILDKDRIRQVIINIIDNSIKFSPNGTIINIRGKKQQKELLFEIQDQGRGIPKDHQEKIFSSFYQVDSGEDRKYGGAGLGLAISKSIIDIHGGKFWVESTGKPGKGSIFKFVLPVNSEDFLKKIKETDISNIFKLERNK